MVAAGSHQFGGAKNISLADQEIEVSIGAGSRIAIGAHGQRRTLYDQHVPVEQREKDRSGEIIPRSFSRRTTLVRDELRGFFARWLRGTTLSSKRGKFGGQQGDDAVFFRQGEQRRPGNASQQLAKAREIGVRRCAFEQRGPFRGVLVTETVIIFPGWS